MKTEVVLVLSFEGHQFPDSRIWTRSHFIRPERCDEWQDVVWDVVEKWGGRCTSTNVRLWTYETKHVNSFTLKLKCVLCFCAYVCLFNKILTFLKVWPTCSFVTTLQYITWTFSILTEDLNEEIDISVNSEQSQCELASKCKCGWDLSYKELLYLYKPPDVNMLQREAKRRNSFHREYELLEEERGSPRSLHLMSLHHHHHHGGPEHQYGPWKRLTLT